MKIKDDKSYSLMFDTTLVYLNSRKECIESEIAIDFEYGNLDEDDEKALEEEIGLLEHILGFIRHGKEASSKSYSSPTDHVDTYLRNTDDYFKFVGIPASEVRNLLVSFSESLEKINEN